MSVLPVVAAVVVFVLAAMWASVGALGLSGRLRRNRRLGVRTDETMRSEEAFGVANRVAGPGMLGAAGILVLSGVLTLGVDGAWSVVFAVVGLLVALVVVGMVSGMAVRAAAAVPADDAGCGCCSGSAHEAATEAPSPDTADPADDCGSSSCGACSLRGVCSSETAGSESAQP
ncbi:SdpI family protein [Gordonia rhizosphera NBRC 16068]|uniref:SdpI family protein n=1 Tax=Gordonia rhizosphera TaxID=83341 RepID=UPI003EE30DE4